MDSIDVSNRKPRRIKGTPVVKLRFYVAAAAIVYTVIAGGLLMISPFDSELREICGLQYEAHKQEDLETTPDEKLRRSKILQTYRHITEAQKTDVINKMHEERDGA